MARKSIVDQIWKEGSISKKTLYSMLNYVFNLISEALQEGEEVKISGFGTFKVRQTKDRRGRNPKTGEMKVIKAKRTVQFKASKKLTVRLNMLVKKCKI
jgi:integration host factor subunit alpha